MKNQPTQIILIVMLFGLFTGSATLLTNQVPINWLIPLLGLVLLIGTILLYQKKSEPEKQRQENSKTSLLKESSHGEVFREIAYHANASIVVTDADGKIEWVNPGFTRQTGYDFDEVAGKKPGHFLQGKATKRADAQKFKDGIASLKPFTVEILNYGKNGKPYSIEAIVSPILDEAGKVERFISIQKDVSEVKLKNEELELLYEGFNSSIRYAKKIQDSVLDNFNKFDKHIVNSFVFFAPKDVLSGDIFAIREVEDQFFILCGDCTGHGVPAAFLGLIVLNSFDAVLFENKSRSPGEIIKKTYQRVNKILHHEIRNDLMDSFDLAVVKIENPKSQQKSLTIASCRTRVLLIEEGIPTEVVPNRSAPGIGEKENIDYEDTTFETQGNTSIYLWTDGFTDQMGGVLGKKYSRKNFQQFLQTLSSIPMAMQEESVKNEFETWKGNNIQLDDVTVIGLKL